jgi:hypothetical protein
VEDTNVPDGNTLADKVEINLDMLGVLVLDGVSGEVGDTDIVAVDQSGPQVVDEANTPLPRHWPRRGTSPQHSNERRRSDASRTRRRGCYLGTPCSSKWIDECRDNRPSQH